MATEPKCPSCKVVGLKHIVSEPSVQESKGGIPWFDVAYCAECGHVYGVFAKNVVNSERKLPIPVPGGY